MCVLRAKNKYTLERDNGHCIDTIQNVLLQRRCSSCYCSQSSSVNSEWSQPWREEAPKLMVPCPHLRGICSRLIKLITSKLWEAPHQCCLGTLALELGSCLHNRYILIWAFQIDLIFCQNGSDLPSGQTGVAPSVHVAVLESLHCPWWGLNQTCIDFHI